MGETQLGTLQRARNRAMRVISHCDKYTKIKYMLRVLQFMSVKQRLHCTVCIFIYEILNNMLPLLLRNKIEIAGTRDGQVILC